MSLATKPPAKKSGSAEDLHRVEGGDPVRDILVEAARTQLAAVTAVTTFWAGGLRSRRACTRRPSATGLPTRKPTAARTRWGGGSSI